MSEKESNIERKEELTPREQVHIWIDEIIADPTSDIDSKLGDIVDMLVRFRYEQENGIQLGDSITDPRYITRAE